MCGPRPPPPQPTASFCLGSCTYAAACKGRAAPLPHPLWLRPRQLRPGLALGVRRLVTAVPQEEQMPLRDPASSLSHPCPGAPRSLLRTTQTRVGSFYLFPPSFFLIKIFKKRLKYSCFTMLCQPLLYNSDSVTHTHAFVFILFSIVFYHRILSIVPCAVD